MRKKTTKEERREIVGYCLEQGKDYKDTAAKYGVSYSQVYQWVRHYEECGEGCPFEEIHPPMSCQALRRSGVQRVWRVPVRDVEELMHDSDLYGLAKQIEASLGSHARFMLRPGDPSEIRILVEAPNEEKCLLAMLRFTWAAEKKGILTGQAVEEEL